MKYHQKFQKLTLFRDVRVVCLRQKLSVHYIRVQVSDYKQINMLWIRKHLFQRLAMIQARYGLAIHF